MGERAMKGIRYMIGCLLVCLMACQQHESLEQSEEPVELIFKLNLKDDASRGLADGDVMNVVSVYLIDDANRIVKKENIQVEDATEVEVTFGGSDNLKQGMYTLMAVANHAALPSFDSSSYTALMNNKVHATDQTDNISSKNVVQPLSLMKQVELQAGQNNVEGELVRTFARFRIEVKNNSGSMPLKIENLTFSNNFAQQQAYVFDDGSDRKYGGTVGAPVATSEHALVSFAKDANSSFKTINAQTSAVLFDGYVLESKAADGENYTYTLDINYDDKPSVTNTTVTNVAGVKSNYENAYFLIQNVRSGKFIRDNNASPPMLVQGGNLETLKKNIEGGSSRDYLWELVKVNDNDTYRIKNVATQRYVGQPGEGSVRMESSDIGNHSYKFYNFGTTAVQMSYNNNSGRSYLNDWAAGGSVIGGWDKDDNGCSFKLILVEKSIKFNEPIPLKTIDPVTQQSSLVTAIKRNDFINVLVTVSYNPVAGKFEFVVEDWSTGGGNVEFN